MRPQLIILALVSGTLASTKAARRDAIVGDAASTLRPSQRSGLVSEVLTLQSRHEHDQGGECSGPERRRWFWHLFFPNTLDPRESDDGDDCNEDEGEGNSVPPNVVTTTVFSLPTQSNTMTDSVDTRIPTSGTGTSIPTTSQTITPSSATATTADTLNLQNQDHGQNNAWKIAVGVFGGLFGLFLLLLIGHWAVVRPRRRNRLSQQPTGSFAKDADLESHVTVDLRIRTPRSEPNDPTSSNDTLSGYTVNIAGASNPPALGRPVFESVAGSLSMPTPPGSAHTGMYPALQRTPNGPSPAISRASLRDVDEVQRSAHSEARRPQTYAHARRLQGPAALPVFPRLPPPLQICAPIHSVSPEEPSAVELDDRPPPPRYPEATATSPASCDLSPITPIAVSPLSMTSSHGGNVQTRSAPNEAQHPSRQQQQEYKGPQQPNYECYEPSTLPEVVSPIYQLGQTSATLPEYDESAETAREGNSNNHHSLASRNVEHDGGEKQALPQSMTRY